MGQGLYDRLTGYIIENQEKFYRLAYSYVRNQEDALDVVQSAVCKALEHCGDIKNEEAVRTWFYRILVNESLTYLRQRKTITLTGEDPRREEPYYERGYEPESGLWAQLDRLEEEVREIIRLRYLEELSLKEISGITGMNLNTVKTKLYRGLKLLRENIREVEG